MKKMLQEGCHGAQSGGERTAHAVRAGHEAGEGIFEDAIIENVYLGSSVTVITSEFFMGSVINNI